MVTRSSSSDAAGGSSTSEHVKVQQSIAFRRKLIPVIFALNRGLIMLRYGGEHRVLEQLVVHWSPKVNVQPL